MGAVSNIVSTTMVEPDANVFLDSSWIRINWLVKVCFFIFMFKNYDKQKKILQIGKSKMNQNGKIIFIKFFTKLLAFKFRNRKFRNRRFRNRRFRNRKFRNAWLIKEVVMNFVWIRHRVKLFVVVEMDLSWISSIGIFVKVFFEPNLNAVFLNWMPNFLCCFFCRFWF